MPSHPAPGGERDSASSIGPAESAISLRPVVERDLLAGKYRLLATLGHGGMADVFLGAATGPAGFNKLVVIKRLRSSGEDPALVQMFFDEARLAARLNHPNIVHTYEVDQSPEGYMLVMEYLEGQSLRRFAKAMRMAVGSFDPVLAAFLISEALIGLHYVHEMRDYDGTPLDVVHRDVSPQNLFITYEGQVKVLDFGIAKGGLNVTDTQSGVLKGKISYMAPEQASEGEVDRRADIFSAGVVLWELLTGEKLFKGDSIAALHSLANAPIEPPSSYAPGVPAELDAIVMTALSRSPHARFPSALVMSRALSDWLHEEGHVVRREDIALHMQQLFAGARESMARRIQVFMSSRASDLPPFSEPAGPLSGVRPAVKKEKPFPTMLIVGAAFGLGLVAAAGIAAYKWRAPSGRSAAPSPGLAAMTVSDKTAEGGEQTFHLTLGSDPPEAQVEWGGNFVGQTPMLIDLSPGQQSFVLSREGFFKATVVMTVTDAMVGRTESRTVVLVPRAKGRVTPPILVPGNRAAPAPKGAAPIAPPPSPGPTPPSPEVAGGTISAPTSATLSPVPGAALAKAVPAPAPDPPPPPAAPAPAPAPQQAAAPAPPAPPTVLPFGPEMSRPVLLSGSDLVPPREALVAGVSGTVIAKCTIMVEGNLRNCRIIKGLPYLDKAMLDMLASRRYSPVTYQGKPVSVEYVFNLKVAPQQSR
jgi:serine/threonine protein kinase